MRKQRPAAKENSKPAAITQRIYVGPKIDYLRSGTIITGELPGGIQALVDKCPAISDLLVPVADYTTARTEVQRQGSKLWFAARNVRRQLI